MEYNSDLVMYYHGGAGNHGCEALVRTIAGLCEIDKDKIALYSYRPNEDIKYGLLDVVQFSKKSKLDATELIGNYKKNTVAMSIGGDNYCGYPDGTKKLAKYNKLFHEKGVKTALIGCSIEPGILEYGEVLGDLCRFDLISARETITYNALKAKGVTKNLHLIPDSAFTLQKVESGVTLRDNTIGINVSSMVSGGDDSDLVYENIIQLVDYIISKTNYNIALIPHVTQDFNDDGQILKSIFNHFSDTTGRIRLITGQYNCTELKDIISQCRMVIAARTHCSVAAYSTCVPTLVLGYSVKSRGMATDIFGTNKDYVKSIQDIKNTNEITESFKWLDKNQATIKKHLKEFMPNYIEKAKRLKKAIDDLRQNNKAEELKNPTLYRQEGKAVEAKPAIIGEYQKGKISIITSLYNSEQYVGRYLDSIMCQTNNNIQLILVNDGSTDRTEEIIADYIPVLNNKGIDVIYLKQENGGIGSAYNLAIKYVNGEYFAWCDSDNFFSSDYAKTILEYFDKHPTHKILRHDGHMIDDSELQLMCVDENSVKFSVNSPYPHDKQLFMNAILERNFHFGNIVIKTEAFDSVSDRSIFPARAGQNWQLTLPMFYNFEAFYVNEPLFYFVKRSSSISNESTSSNDGQIHKQMDQYKEILENIIEKLNPNDKNYLLKLIKQKYIVRNLEWAKAGGNGGRIKYYQKLFDKYVVNDNVYEQELAKIDKKVKTATENSKKSY
jgi:glycosyltransferase involved in cell wall biosynthesis/polysaccharide pyruvyl transferase WcaK-like protein